MLAKTLGSILTLPFFCGLGCVILAGESDSLAIKPDSKKILEQLKALPDAERNDILAQFGAIPRPVDSTIRKIDEQAEKPAGEEKKEHKRENYSIHYQTTIIDQKHDSLLHAPYENPNTSLMRKEPERTSVTATVFFGRRLWEGGEIFFNPEISGGEGLSKVTGIAGFPNGDIEKVGKPKPTVYVSRLFLRQTFNFGCEDENVEDGLNSIAGERSVNRLTLQLGKMAVTDVFDAVSYAHDPRTQFMNWSIMDFGAWDYAADTRGYDNGFTAEYNTKNWALRYGMFMEPDMANGANWDYKLDKANAQHLEFERRYSIHEKPGTARVLVFENNAHMGSYRKAIAQGLADGNPPDIAKARSYRGRLGLGVSAEQGIFDDLGAFVRASWNQGRTETWSFTEIDRSLSAGLSMKGTRWGRPDDVIGVAGVINGLSPDHRDYLRAGGVGFIVGDGRLNYAPETILESYYKLQFHQYMSLSLDYQFVRDPAYNKDRGPVNIGGARLHVEF